MASENNMKLALLICLAFALILYHAIEVLAPAPVSVSAELLNLIKVAQVVSAGAIFFALLYWSPFVRLVLRSKYVGGVWKGESGIENKQGVFQRATTEEFEIEQSIFQAVVNGRSYDENGNIKSIWSARLYRVEGCRFWFAMELSTTDPEVGILQFSKQQERIDGLYHPGNPRDARVFRFFASRSKHC
ncbi:MAG TPA: hypothetical protein VJ734_06795 [Nitrosospira sp.]|jgi:hypothetical protein|nr:hypothetical protein [Nitrosospira sp.]